MDKTLELSVEFSITKINFTPLTIKNDTIYNNNINYMKLFTSKPWNKISTKIISSTKTLRSNENN